MCSRDVTILRSLGSVPERERIAAELHALADLIGASRGEAEVYLEIGRLGTGQTGRRYRITATTLAVVPDLPAPVQHLSAGEASRVVLEHPGHPLAED